jgi:hypothetical protein
MDVNIGGHRKNKREIGEGRADHKHNDIGEELGTADINTVIRL